MTSYSTIIEQAESSSARLVTVERVDASAVVTLADPEHLNVLSAALTVQLRRQLELLVADPAVRTVILTGAGRAYSAGGDLRMMRDVIADLHDDSDDEGAYKTYQWIRYQFGALVRLIARSDTAFIAAVNGPAAGVGLALALSSDIAIGSDSAVLVPAFGRLGLVPEVGTSWALTRALGYRGAFAFFVDGRHLDAREAFRLGLLNEVVADDQLLARAQEWSDRIRALPRHALPIGKPLLRAAADATWDHSLALEEFAEPMCFTTKGFSDGVAAALARTSSSHPGDGQSM